MLRGSPNVFFRGLANSETFCLCVFREWSGNRHVRRERQGKRARKGEAKREKETDSEEKPTRERHGRDRRENRRDETERLEGP
ncbi:hypothetical protein TGARI_215055 [Toxoplasma gondii ARI]|uniref:Uncharacterized protein n=1 Tax=Toxoplasma gondii ARI TaxID=1074872 RepID=A0A139XVQ6_TOXGO|nr:hypothetical protein TGARI_215055 [Toxoplasma gondii ARI]